MRTIAAAKFKEQCLKLLDEVGPEGIVITKRGKPVARLVPMRQNDGDLIGIAAGEFTIADPDDDLLSGGGWEDWDPTRHVEP